ncbi:hypothetical protein H2248_007465 [Termitomyces sp. 'cryptogamus']|nr:hypothetical protein H2248_007465 [Termitomyces sp. 'cryptogamus']
MDFQEPLTAPKAIVDAIEGSSLEISFGAPVDQCLSIKKQYEDKTDGKQEKMQKKADEDREGREVIFQASLHCYHEKKLATTTSSPSPVATSAKSAKTSSHDCATSESSDHPHSSYSDTDSDVDQQPSFKPANLKKSNHTNATSPKCATKHGHYSGSNGILFTVESMFQEEHKHHQKDEACILEQMDLNNRQYAEAYKDTKEFQSNLLGIFHQIVNK